MGEAIAEKKNKEKHLPRVRMSDLRDIRQPLTRITFLYPCLWSERRHNLVMPFVSWCAILRTISSVKFISAVVSNSLWHHESQQARPPCPSPTPGFYTDLCPSSQWCHPAISSSVIPFSSCPQSFTASGSFPMSQLFTWGGQSIRVSASTSVLPMNTQDWYPLGRTGWISLAVQGTLKGLLQHHSSKGSILWLSPFFTVQLSHPYVTTGKTIALTRRTFVGKVISCLGWS